MGYYDLFSYTYDGSVAKHYAAPRAAACAALDLKPGLTVLDLPCGTGLSFPGIAPAIGPEGLLLGADLSAGMLKQAKKKAEQQGWSQVVTLQADASTITPSQLEEAAGRPVSIDRLQIFLGMTCFPDWRNTFTNLWTLLEPGGRCVVVDIHTPKKGFYGHLATFVAQADVSRPFWEPLEAVCEGFERSPQESKALHGGTIYLATGTKPA